MEDLGIHNSNTGIRPACSYASKRHTIGTGVQLRWKDPANISSSVRWAKTVIVRNDTEDPTKPADGTVVVITSVRDKHLSTPFTDANGIEESHYRAFPYYTDGTYSDYDDNIFKSYILYSYTIDESNRNEASCVEYGDDCTNFDPISMNFGNNTISMGSWAGAFFMPRPCMLHRADENHYESYVDYYLDPNDYTKKEDGISASDVTNADYDGNAMMEFPCTFYKAEKTGNRIKISISNIKLDDGFECWSCKSSRKGGYSNFFYMPIYEGTVIDDVLRSISTGEIPTGYTNATEDWTYSTSNNVFIDAGWSTTLWADEQLLRVLGFLVMKRLSSRKAIGGVYNSSEKLEMACGAGNTYGLFYGKSDGSYTPTKFFGMENFWGHRWRRAQGIIVIGCLIKSKMTITGLDDTEGTIVTSDKELDYSVYNDTGCTIPEDKVGKGITLMWDNPFAMFMPRSVDLEENLGTSYSGGLYSSYGVRSVLCGGSVASGMSSLSATSAHHAPSFQPWNSGASLSYHYL